MWGVPVASATVQCQRNSASLWYNSTIIHNLYNLCCSLMAKTECLRRSFIPQAIRLLNTDHHVHNTDPLGSLNALHSTDMSTRCTLCYCYTLNTTAHVLHHFLHLPNWYSTSSSYYYSMPSLIRSRLVFISLQDIEHCGRTSFLFFSHFVLIFPDVFDCVVLTGYTHVSCEMRHHRI